MIRPSMLLVCLCLTVPSIAVAAPDSKAAVKADYTMVCTADVLSHADKIKDPSEKAVAISHYVATHLKTDEVSNFFSDLRYMPADMRSTALKRAAKKAGYTGDCSILDQPKK